MTTIQSRERGGACHRERSPGMQLEQELEDDQAGIYEQREHMA